MTIQPQDKSALSGHDSTHSEVRRYLVNIDSNLVPQVFTDCLILGAGIAGLRAAIEVCRHCNPILACKGTLDESNTWKAQGGIASVQDKTDSFDSHIADTLRIGCGINDPSVVELVVRQGPELLEQLLKWGAKFDMVNGQVATTLEGGHTQPRIAHAHGDETGRIIAETLIRKVKQSTNIKILENFYAIDLLTHQNNECVGVIGYDGRGLVIIWSATTILATGGTGQLYRETTNPRVATGDGLAMAYRAGAVLQDLEFMQFHPTTLYIAGASRALITEALRGEGALLVDKNGKRFMPEYHASAELAPRDVVSRAILSQMLKTKSTHVYLDVRHMDKNHFAKRFPHIYELCESFDIDTGRDLIPVRPSAHYMIGGVKVDTSARTSIKNLCACGEVTATGFHGANRLGSNSLLEGLAFGRIAGQTAIEAIANPGEMPKHVRIKYDIQDSDRTRLDTADVRNSLRALMWRNVGITRRAKPLAEAHEIIGFWQRYVMDKVFDSPQDWECQNMLIVSLLITRAAALRQESRGVHFRSDYPNTDDKRFKKHIEIHR